MSQAEFWLGTLVEAEGARTEGRPALGAGGNELGPQADTSPCQWPPGAERTQDLSLPAFICGSDVSPMSFPG